MEQVPQEANMMSEQKYQMKDQMKQIVVKLDKKRKNYRVFQVNNNLTDRDPQYHTKIWKKYYLLVLIFAFGAFVIGVGFFIQADSIAVSATYAVAIVNVLMAFVAGNR